MGNAEATEVSATCGPRVTKRRMNPRKLHAISSARALSFTKRGANVKMLSKLLLVGATMIPGCLGAAESSDSFDELRALKELNIRKAETEADQRRRPPTLVSYHGPEEDSMDEERRLVRKRQNLGARLTLSALNDYKREKAINRELKRIANECYDSVDRLAMVKAVVENTEKNKPIRGIWTQWAGETLSAKWAEIEAKGGMLEFSEIIEVLRSTFIAVRQLWSVGVIHNDVFPKNLCQQDGKITLIDFGEATSWKRFVPSYGRMGEWSIKEAKMEEIKNILWNILSQIPMMKGWLIRSYTLLPRKSETQYNLHGKKVVDIIKKEYGLNEEVSEAFDELWEKTTPGADENGFAIMKFTIDEILESKIFDMNLGAGAASAKADPDQDHNEKAESPRSQGGLAARLERKEALAKEDESV